MYFLEQIVAEWYAYKGYFVRTNIRFGRRKKGGWKGEMDVIAFHPIEKNLIHIETSTDSDTWSERKSRFQRKFRDANDHYHELFKFEIKEIQRIAIVGMGKPKTPPDFGDEIKIILISDFFRGITSIISKIRPTESIPEQYPLLRAIQFATYWEDKNILIKK
jgi:hypothetical protein